MAMNFLVYATFPLFLLAIPVTQMVQASGVILGRQAGNGAVPAAGTLARCPKSCGNISFDYPFGIGNGCFWGADFNLSCVGNDPTAPSLFLHNSTIQVISNIVTVNSNSTFNGLRNMIEVNFSHTIPMRSGVDRYDMNWTTPGDSFILYDYFTLNITGCGFDASLVDHEYGNIDNCTSTCPNEYRVGTEDIQNCNGTGCCSLSVITIYDVPSFTLRFVRHGKGNLKSHHNQSSLWDAINVTTNQIKLIWRIADQPSCDAARKKKRYACINGNSVCNNDNIGNKGYSCWCDNGYIGNPYVSGGCSRDKGYNPIQHNANCTRQCGNINVSFPFGLEEGCFGRKQFYLNCTDTTSSVLLLDNTYNVTKVNIDEGLIEYNDPYQNMATDLYDSEGQILYFYDANSSVTVQWAVANLTCYEAKHNISGYACVSANSECIAVTSTTVGPVGYRCKCSHGFQGNPYIQDGCEDIDECLQTNNCMEICKNNIGSYDCIPCPHKTEYDPVKKQCTSRQHKNLLIGIFAGILVVLIVLFGIVVINQRLSVKRQDSIRKSNEYFQQHGGQLLSDMMRMERTLAFTLYRRDDILQATNKFDRNGIIGEGGQGTVYKGILDNTLVAIKTCKGVDERRRADFAQELVILCHVHHDNIVKLLGCCLQFEVPILVYEFVPNKTLHDLIHGQDRRSCITLGTRLRIAAESAEAIAHLHSLNHAILHGDVKSANILLGENLVAKVSDFGCSIIAPKDEQALVAKGTIGYLDPEYLQSCQLTDKSDVYSFGVVLLELLTGKKPRCLATLFQDAMREGTLGELVDREIANEDDMEVIRQVAELASHCLVMPGEKRLTMRQVAGELRRLSGLVQNRPQAVEGLMMSFSESGSSTTGTSCCTRSKTTDFYSTRKISTLSIGTG